MQIRTYQLQDNFSNIRYEDDQAVWFGDPCYVVPDESHDSGNNIWGQLIDAMYTRVDRQHPVTGEVYRSTEPLFDDKQHIRVVEIDTSLVGMGGKFYMWSTAYGDGCYPLTYRHHLVKKLGVDAGCLSMIPMSLIKGWGAEASARQLGYVADEPASPRHNGAYLSVTEGDMHWGDYDLLTGGNSQEDEEWDDHWMECDETSYV